jgi:hypothetical protein
MDPKNPAQPRVCRLSALSRRIRRETIAEVSAERQRPLTREDLAELGGFLLVLQEIYQAPIAFHMIVLLSVWPCAASMSLLTGSPLLLALRFALPVCRCELRPLCAASTSLLTGSPLYL